MHYLAWIISLSLFSVTFAQCVPDLPVSFCPNPVNYELVQNGLGVAVFENILSNTDPVLCSTDQSGCTFCDNMPLSETPLYCARGKSTPTGGPDASDASALMMDVDLDSCLGGTIGVEFSFAADGTWDPITEVDGLGDLFQIDYFCKNEVTTTGGIPDDFNDVTLIAAYTGEGTLGLVVDMNDPSDVFPINVYQSRCFTFPDEICAGGIYTLSIRHAASASNELLAVRSFGVTCVLPHPCFDFWIEPPVPSGDPWSLYHHGCLRWDNRYFTDETATIYLQTTSFTGSDFDVEVCIIENIPISTGGFTWDKIYGVLPSTKSRVYAVIDGSVDPFYSDEFEVTIPIIEYDNPCSTL